MNTAISTVLRRYEPSHFELHTSQPETDTQNIENSLDRPRQAWQWMRQTLQAPGPNDWVRSEVAASWLRCLDEYHLRFNSPLLRPALPERPIPEITSRPEIISLSRMVERQARAFIGEAGLTFLIVDAECRLISIKGRELHDCPIGELLAYPQANWGESVIGNNGIGSAAITQEPIAFCGEEHYLPLLHPFTSAGFPLFSQNGKLLAIIGLLSGQRVDPGLLKTLACLVGNRVEEDWLKHNFPQGIPIRLRCGAAEEEYASAPDGIVMLDGDGRILAISHCAQQWLALRGLLAVVGCKLSTVLDVCTQVTALDSLGRFQPWQAKPLDNPRPLGNNLAAESNLTLPASNGRNPSATLECHLAEKAVRLQERRIPILVVGESGAGKEHLVRMAYEAGPRRGGPFIAVNCASIPRDLIESELFGYASGSFTGARKEGKVGKFLLADKGVLFLDEIGDMGLDLQAVLLRVLESSEFFPVGASQPVRVDVQIFAATNVPIQQAVREGQFRRDLYYRLNGAQLILPPLREREDKHLIIQRILAKELALSDQNNGIRLSDAVLELFLRHPWPGNVRQLSNVIRSSLYMAGSDEITLADLPDDFLSELAQGADFAPSSPALTPIPHLAAEEPAIPAMTLAEWELKGIKVALESCRGNLTQTARILGITRGTLYKKMGQYGLSAR